MKIELVTLKLIHLHQMGETNAMQNSMRVSGPSFCLLADGEPVAAGGIVRLWDNVGKAWTLHTEGARASPLIMRRIQKHVTTLIPAVRDAMGLVRLEAETLAQPRFCTWLSRLGFVAEGKMCKYRGGEDYFRFAWVK